MVVVHEAITGARVAASEVDRRRLLVPLLRRRPILPRKRDAAALAVGAQLLAAVSFASNPKVLTGHALLED